MVGCITATEKIGNIIIADILTCSFIYYFPECDEVLATFEVFVKSFSGRVADIRDGDGEALGPVRGLT